MTEGTIDCISNRINGINNEDVFNMDFPRLDGNEELWLKDLVGSTRYGVWNRGMPMAFAALARKGLAEANPKGVELGYQATLEGKALISFLNKQELEASKRRKKKRRRDDDDDYEDDDWGYDDY